MGPGWVWLGAVRRGKAKFPSSCFAAFARSLITTSVAIPAACRPSLISGLSGLCGRTSSCVLSPHGIDRWCLSYNSLSAGVWPGLAWQGKVGWGTVWKGKVRWGPVRFGVVRH